MPRKPKPKPKPKSEPTITAVPPHLKTGNQVEISSDDQGYRGSWYTGTVIRRVSSKEPDKYVVQYTSIFKDEEGKKPLREVLDVAYLRPLAPKEKARKFHFSEKVDAFHNDGWWEGVITEDLGNGRFNVYFRPSKEQIEFGEKELRLHREWVDGVWKPPLEEEDDNTTKGMKFDNGMTEETKLNANKTIYEMDSNNLLTEEKLESNNSRTGENFSKGTRVEVSSDEEGFKGAWFAATIVEALGRDKYLIQYESLRTEDDKEFLKEEADAVHVRPYPPETVVDRYKMLEEVDALHNDGWWVGVVSKVLANSRYMVYFQTTSEELEFDHSQLRLHQDWIDGKWVVASQALKL